MSIASDVAPPAAAQPPPDAPQDSPEQSSARSALWACDAAIGMRYSRSRSWRLPRTAWPPWSMSDPRLRRQGGRESIRSPRAARLRRGSRIALAGRGEGVDDVCCGEDGVRWATLSGWAYGVYVCAGPMTDDEFRGTLDRVLASAYVASKIPDSPGALAQPATGERRRVGHGYRNWDRLIRNPWPGRSRHWFGLASSTRAPAVCAAR